MSKTNPPPGVTIDPARRQAAQQCFARGTEVFKKGDYDYAIKLFKDACKLAPNQLVYRQHLRLAAKKKFDNNKKGSRLSAVTTMGARAGLKAAKAKKDFLKALECCEDILSENPWDSSVLLELASVCETLGWMETSVWSAESSLERDPMDPNVNRALALIYEKSGAFTKAIDCWERVKKARPADEEADRRMKDLAASATIDRGGYEGAESFTKAVADKAKTQELLDESKGGGVTEARMSSQQAELEAKIRSQPTVLAPYVQLSQMLRRQGKFEKAREVIENAKQATGSPDADTELAEIEMERLRADLAVAEKQAAEKPDDAEAKKKAAELGRALNDFELREYQRRSERIPTDLNLRAELGIRLAKADLHDQAITELQKARGAPGRKLDALTWLGHCFQAKKNLRLARRNYEEALEGLSASDQTRFLELHYRLGRVCEEMGDRAEAIKHYDEVAAVEYGYRDVAQRLDKISAEDASPAT